MKKIVINNQHGGFSLSHKAFLMLRELGEKTALSEPDYGEFWDDGSGPREQNFIDEMASFCRDIPRDSPELVKTVSELGKIANGFCSSLKIVEIPDDVEWEIQEYDGLEWVAEKHRMWT